MKRFSFVCMMLCLCVLAQAQRIDLSGIWRFAIDRDNAGVASKWFSTKLQDAIILPGSMMTGNKGDEVTVNTPWTGQVVDSAYFKSDEYARYRQPGNIKVPYWLQPNKYYKGVAWYQRDIVIPAEWKDRAVSLFLERCHWETRLWVDNVAVGMRNALGAPHFYDLTGLLKPGKHVITILVDNRVKDIDPGTNAHSISDHTQGNWNGIAGAIYLEAKPSCHWGQIDLFPDLDTRTMVVKSSVRNNSKGKRKVICTFSFGDRPQTFNHRLKPGDNFLLDTLSLPANLELWDEFHPNLYSLQLSLFNKKSLDIRQIQFGCRKWTTDNGILSLNGHQVFMRGTLHCAAFPLTGFPATDKEEWMREFNICKAHGLNHVRFHSWCPPEAAFQAADELGMYLEIECSAWANQSTSIGDGKPIDEFIKEESHRIVNAFGNHPSFCMLMYGNEPAGQNQKKYLTDFVNYWKTTDNRRLYSSAGGWPNLPVNDFLSDPNPRIQRWGEGVNSIINAKSPQTAYDWSQYVIKQTQPIISHEIGQWCVYPNYKEMSEYTGVYKPRNFEIFQEMLKEHGMANLADSFLLASGKLQTLCYKADIEAALRTPRFGGFQLLSLNDFPGQGTALVGTLDVFWKEKGYVTPQQYSRFCNSIVPLARMPRLIYQSGDTLVARIEVANYQQLLTNPYIEWKMTDMNHNLVTRGTFVKQFVPIGEVTVGTLNLPLGKVSRAAQLNLEVSVDDYSNDWNIWVYPKTAVNKPADILFTDTFDAAAIAELNRGGKVLFSLKKGSLSDEFGGNIPVGFSTIFWNTAWSRKQPPHTMGILCNPRHPALAEFPTEYYSDYQWWDAMSHSQVVNIGKLSSNLQPIVRVIDDWFTNRSLGLIFEAKVGKGKLIISGVDFSQQMEQRAEARQLLRSLYSYMESTRFNPQTELSAEVVSALMNR